MPSIRSPTGRDGKGNKSATALDALHEALACFKAGRFEEAERKARDVLVKRPRDASALNIIAGVALTRSQYAEAVSCLNRALTDQPRNPFIHFNLGEACRRAGSVAESLPHYRRAVEIREDYAEAYAQMGEAYRALGDWASAEEAYRTAIQKKPNLTVALNGLGVLMLDHGNDLQAAARQFEAAIVSASSAPPSAAAALWANLGNARLRHGAILDGIDALSDAVARSPESADYWRLLAHGLRNVVMVRNSSRFRKQLLALFERMDVNPRSLATAALVLLKSDPDVADLLATVAGNPRNAADAVQKHRPAFKRLSQDSLFLSLLSNAPIPDVAFEVILTSARLNCLLALTSAYDIRDVGFDVSFVSALARQCFLNEYVYFVREDELTALRSLLADLERPDLNTDSLWMKIAIAACYVPLNQTPISDRELPGAPASIRALLREQIEEPRREKLLRERIESLAELRDSVSLAVQKQYEENPYPRWTRCQMGTPLPLGRVLRGALPYIKDEQIPSTDTPRILIAGCGTGLQTMRVVNSYKNASILAVDLSRSSLAYGMRKVEEYGVNSVQHLHADILDLEKLEERFDIIESFGVIHHMRSPAQGLRILANLLKPGGLLFLGLYSEIARQSVVIMRNIIAERNYPATVNGIRAARRDIMTDDVPPALSVLISPASDFWTTSECRDLIFHTEEHRFTLLEIEEILSLAGLDFLGLELLNPVDRERFRSTFPGEATHQRPSVWHEFETRFPDVFGDTYRLWVRKPAASD